VQVRGGGGSGDGEEDVGRACGCQIDVNALRGVDITHGRSNRDSYARFLRRCQSRPG